MNAGRVPFEASKERSGVCFGGFRPRKHVEEPRLRAVTHFGVQARALPVGLHFNDITNQVHNSEPLKKAPKFKGGRRKVDCGFNLVHLRQAFSILHSLPSSLKRRIPPFDPGSFSAERDACRRFDLSNPVSKVRCMVYDEGSAVFGKDIIKKPVKKYIPVHFHHCFAIIPGRRANETVIRPFISPIQKLASEPILQTTERFDTFHNIFHRDSFAEILKHPVTE